MTCGQPTTATTEENVAHVHRVVMGDRHLTLNQIANTAGISREQIENILHNPLGMAKVSTKWVPQLSTPDQRLTLSQSNLGIFEADQASSLDPCLTQDECWDHHFEPETKRQSVQRKHPGSPPLKAELLKGNIMPILHSCKMPLSLNIPEN